MRQNNQNKRLRGRGRKGPNPLTRSFESNGPDVKIRGTAMHIAEKYQQLARDAMVSGDRIMAENYLQHAEHYSRIVAAAQAPSNGPATQSQRNAGDNDDEDGEEQPAVAAAASEAPASTKARVMPEDAPQPFVDRMPGVDSKNGAGNGSAETKDGAEKDGETKEASKPTRSRSAKGGSRDKAKASPKAAAKDAGEAEAPAAEASSPSGEEEGDEPARPRRRARGARGRNVRRAAANAADQDGGSEETPASEATSEA